MIYRKRVIIVNNNLAIGGIQRALVNLLDQIKDEYDITLFLFSKNGDFEKDIPKQVKVIEANLFLKLLGISQLDSKKEGIFLYLLRSILVLWTKLFSDYFPIKLLISTQRKLKDYDIAISYLQSSDNKTFYGGCNEFVLNRIEASKKIAFIHSDYMKFGGNTLKNKRNYLKFDKVITVSEGCKKSFIEAIPELERKTLTVSNFHNYKKIKLEASSAAVEYNGNNFNVITVSRLSEEKGIIRTIESVNQLIKKNYKIVWHIIGDGSKKGEIEELISYYSLDDYIILYGNKENPYRYMKNADLFLLPSYHEAAPMVLEEAKCIGLPILTTNTISAVEMVEQCGAGWVCENTDIAITEALEYILNNRGELLQIREELKNQQFSQESRVAQLGSVIDGEHTDEH